MKAFRNLFISFAAVFSVASYGQVAPPANSSATTSPSEQAIVLPEYQVTGTKANQYRAEDAASVARIATSILDSPVTVNVISPALMQDLGAETMFNAAIYFAGMSNGRCAGAGGFADRIDFRGFQSYSKLLDDFSQFIMPTAAGYHAQLDTALIDHAELVMGPDAILSPTGTPGGSINVFTKSPQFTAGTDISAQYGNYNAGGVSVDTTGPIGNGKHWAYRIIADYQDYQTFLPGYVNEVMGCAELTYKFSDTAKINFKYISEAYLPTGAVSDWNDQGPEVFAPYTIGGNQLGVSGSNIPAPGFTYGGWNGVATWSHQYDRINIYESELTAALGDHINMRFGAQCLLDDYTADNCYPNVTPAETWDPHTGVCIGVTQLNPASLSELGNYNHDLSRDIQVQNDYAGNFKVGGVSLQPLLGWEYESFETTQWAIQDLNMPTANILGQSDGPQYTPYNPVHPPYTAYTHFAANLPENGWLMQGYGLIRAGLFDDHLFLTGSWSRTWADVNVYHYSGIYLNGIGQVGSTAAPTVNTFGNTGNTASPTANPYHDEYLAGIVAKPLPNVSVYGSVSTNAGIAGNTPLWQNGKQYEYGVKADFFNHRLIISADHFQITQNNLLYTNPLFITGQSTIVTLLTDEVNHGFEFNATGGITENLSVILSYTNMRCRDLFNRKQQNIPDNLCNLLLNYHFTEGLLKNAGVFLGVQHSGSVVGDASPLGFTSLGVPEQPGYSLAPWTAASAGASYLWRNYHFNLNVDNLTDAKFWWQTSGRLGTQPYPALTVRLSTTIHI